MTNSQRLLPLLTIFWLSFAQAGVVGTYGDVYSIDEQDFLEFIQQRLKTMQASGKITELQNSIQVRSQQQAERPLPVTGITRAQAPKSWFFDPSITLPHDFSDANGRIFAKQGAAFNPLSQVQLSKALLFYDADDKAQVKWAKTMDEKLQGKVKLILVKGSVVQEAKRFEKAVYFDQEGRLTTRFNIQHTPAMVTQEGLQLRIQEVKL